MKKTIIAGAAAIALAAPAYAEIEGDISVTYGSQYSFRGVNDILTEALGLANLDTDNTYTTDVNVNYALNDQWTLFAGATIRSLSDTSVDHNSFRIGARYTTDCYTLEFGHQRHQLDSILNNFIGSLDTTELYINASTVCPLTGGTLNLFVAHDLDELSGTYAELSLNKVWDLCDKTKLNVTAGVSYSFDYWDDIVSVGGVNFLDTGSDWNHAYLTIAIDYQATENLTVSPYITFSEGFGALDPSGTPIALVNSLEESGEMIYGLKASVKF